MIHENVLSTLFLSFASIGKSVLRLFVNGVVKDVMLKGARMIMPINYILCWSNSEECSTHPVVLYFRLHFVALFIKWHSNRLRFVSYPYRSAIKHAAWIELIDLTIESTNN